MERSGSRQLEVAKPLDQVSSNFLSFMRKETRMPAVLARMTGGRAIVTKVDDSHFVYRSMLPTYDLTVTYTLKAAGDHTAITVDTVLYAPLMTDEQFDFTQNLRVMRHVRETPEQFAQRLTDYLDQRRPVGVGLE